MVRPTRPPANGFVAAVRKIYNPLGFSKGYNFVLAFIFLGALMGFTLARFQYFNIDGIFCGPGSGASNHAAPGECYFYQGGYERAGIILHLGCILPASFLVCFQFIPAIRHKAIIFHRINGYLVMLLSLAGVVGGLMISRHAFGGGLETQAAAGLISLMFIVSLVLAYINIKRLQIEQHRAWMLRAWFYAGSIITNRPIMFIGTLIISRMGGYYAARPCSQVAFMLKGRNNPEKLFPDCAAYFSGEDLNKWTLVPANINGGSAAHAAASLGASFGMALWIALALHAIGIEIYLHLTPAEHERLRNVSYQRQLEAGMKHPGRAGLTADRLGDSATWYPKTDRDPMSNLSHMELKH